MNTEGETRTRRDRGFQRPSGPALVARPEPLAGGDPVEPPAAATPAPAPPSEPKERPAKQAPTPRSAPNVASAPVEELPMPTPRVSEIRVQFNTKLRPAVIDRTRGFADHHRANIQEIVEQALTEYLNRRGWKDS
jgi:hypothetical protein